MFKNATSAALRFILYRPTLLILLLVVAPILLAYSGPKVPPMPRIEEMQARQPARSALAAVCAPGTRRARCLGSVTGDASCRLRSCETCEGEGRSAMSSASRNPCVPPTTLAEDEREVLLQMIGDAEEP